MASLRGACWCGGAGKRRPVAVCCTQVAAGLSHAPLSCVHHGCLADVPGGSLAPLHGLVNARGPAILVEMPINPPAVRALGCGLACYGRSIPNSGCNRRAWVSFVGRGGEWVYGRRHEWSVSGMEGKGKARPVSSVA